MSRLILAAGLALIHCASAEAAQQMASPRDSVARELKSAEVRLVQADNRFGFRLLKEIISREKETNVFVSPLSVALALGMAYNGAAGETKDAMQETLEVTELSVGAVNEAYRDLIKLLMETDTKVRFDIANSIWYRHGFRFEEEFLGVNRSFFNAEVEGLDFGDTESAGRINGWVNEKTNGKIKKIMEPPISPDKVMFLINAIYFKGTWTQEFDDRLTRDDAFTVPDGSKRPCRMMTQTGDFRYLRDENFQAVDLPYGRGAFRMTIFLPAEGGSVDSLILKLNEENWELWVGGLRKQEVALELPRFRLDYEITLNEVLTALGMGIAFEPGRADFSGMYKGGEPLNISEVKHKTFVQVDEEGTEAAAVTSIGITVTSVRRTERMRVDRPFIFVIRDDHSKAIVFMGRIVEPVWKAES